MVAESHKPVLIVIAGPNGSGKTTITSKILRHEWLEDAVYINPDQVAQDTASDFRVLLRANPRISYKKKSTQKDALFD